MPESAVAGLRQAVPYLRLYRGQTFVVKCGGEAILERAARLALLEQISVLHRLGIRVVLVHGGGPQATELASRLQAASRFVDGRRVTDTDMLLTLVLSLNGEANTNLLAACRELDLPAIGVSGIDAGIASARRRPPKGDLDYGYVGDLEGVDPTPLNALLDHGYLPIVSPLCADECGQVLNVNADTVAAALASAMGAAKLILVTGARGILRDKNDPTSLVSEACLDDLDRLEASGALEGGMMPKAASIRSALEGGVPRVHVIGFEFPDCILTEVFTNEGCGTLIVAAAAAREEERA